MNTQSHHRGIIILIAGSIIAGIAVAVYVHYLQSTRVTLLVPVVEQMQPVQTSPTIPPPPPKETLSQVSPDGKKTLEMTVTTNPDAGKTYVVLVKEEAADPRVLSIMTLPKEESLSIPFNTWSPDDVYVFLHHTSVSGTEATVMRADGKPCTPTEQTINVTSLFTAKNTGNAYQETTGWASDTLLIVNTTTPAGAKGPSYWFEIPSKAIIRLSSQF